MNKSELVDSIAQSAGLPKSKLPKRLMHLLKVFKVHYSVVMMSYWLVLVLLVSKSVLLAWVVIQKLAKQSKLQPAKYLALKQVKS